MTRVQSRQVRGAHELVGVGLHFEYALVSYMYAVLIYITRQLLYSDTPAYTHICVLLSCTHVVQSPPTYKELYYQLGHGPDLTMYIFVGVHTGEH